MTSILLNRNSISQNEFFYCSLSQCKCHPWHYPKPTDQTVPLCTYYGNDCFYSKMENSTYRIKNCNCLQGCSEVKYKFFVASSRKFTEDEIEEMCQSPKPHWLYVFREQEAVAEYKQMKNLSVLMLDSCRLIFGRSHFERSKNRFCRTDF